MFTVIGKTTPGTAPKTLIYDSINVMAAGKIIKQLPSLPVENIEHLGREKLDEVLDLHMRLEKDGPMDPKITRTLIQTLTKKQLDYVSLRIFERFFKGKFYMLTKNQVQGLEGYDIRYADPKEVAERLFDLKLEQFAMLDEKHAKFLKPEIIKKLNLFQKLSLPVTVVKNFSIEQWKAMADSNNQLSLTSKQIAVIDHLISQLLEQDGYKTWIWAA